MHKNWNYFSLVIKSTSDSNLKIYGIRIYSPRWNNDRGFHTIYPNRKNGNHHTDNRTRTEVPLFLFS